MKRSPEKKQKNKKRECNNKPPYSETELQGQESLASGLGDSNP